MGCCVVNLMCKSIYCLSDSCRQQFMDCGGCPLLKDVLLEHVVSCDSVKMKVVWCGCLLNVCCNNGVSIIEN